MRRDVIVSIFLFYVLFALLFVVLFPIYFTYGQVFYRSVSVTERIMSVSFVLLWLALCAFTAYFKKLTCLFGGILFSFLAYLPEMVIPKLSTTIPGSDPNLVTSILDGSMRRLYELINAPMAGVSVLFPPEKALGISKLMLPVLVITFIVTQIFRFYRNAYLADQLLLSDVPRSESAPPQPGDTEAPAPRLKDRMAAFIKKMKTPLKENTAAAETADTEPADTETADTETADTETAGQDAFREEYPEQADRIETPTDERAFDISLSDLEAEADSLSEKGCESKAAALSDLAEEDLKDGEGAGDSDFDTKDK